MGELGHDNGYKYILCIFLYYILHTAFLAHCYTLTTCLLLCLLLIFLLTIVGIIHSHCWILQGGGKRHGEMTHDMRDTCLHVLCEFSTFLSSSLSHFLKLSVMFGLNPNSWIKYICFKRFNEKIMVLVYSWKYLPTFRNSITWTSPFHVKHFYHYQFIVY